MYSKPNKPTLRYAIYVRSRTPADIEQQISGCVAEAQHHGWVSSQPYMYSDVGLNGRTSVERRPNLSALIEAAQCRDRPFDIVIVDELKTFSRVLTDVLSIYSTLSRAAVQIKVARPSTKRDQKATRKSKDRAISETLLEPLTDPK